MNIRRRAPRQLVWSQHIWWVSDTPCIVWRRSTGAEGGLFHSAEFEDAFSAGTKVIHSSIRHPCRCISILLDLRSLSADYGEASAEKAPRSRSSASAASNSASRSWRQTEWKRPSRSDPTWSQSSPCGPFPSYVRPASWLSSHTRWARGFRICEYTCRMV